jgi:hypothetical protein
MQNKITVVDSVMGSGKTSWAIEYINSNPNIKFMYIAPYLKEVDRIMFKTTRYFKSPHQKGEGKLSDLKELLRNGYDICCTHALYRMFDEETRQLVKNIGYTIIIDEAPIVVSEYDAMCDDTTRLQRDDLSILFRSKCISVDENNCIVWNPNDRKMKISLCRVKKLAEENMLMYLDDSFLAWRFPIDNFTVFNEVYILTYLFEGNIIKYYFEAYRIPYRKKSIQHIYGKYTLVDFCYCNGYAFRNLINIYEGRMNTNLYPATNEDKRKERGALSATWFKNPDNAEYISQLKKNLLNWFTNTTGARVDVKMWTAFKKGKRGNSDLNGKGYSRSFVACNCRATNDLSDRYVLAYCVNRFAHPTLKHFFSKYNISVNDDMFALAEFVQWIWRSRIRNGEPIEIYIPSKRMRNLLKKWLGLPIEK